MPTLDDSTIAHVRKCVVSHGFCDVADWVTGLEELSRLADSEIDSLVDPAKSLAEHVRPFPLPLGVTPEIARKDRALFDRVTLELGL